MNEKLKSVILRLTLVLGILLSAIILSGCPEDKEEAPEELYRVGTWAGTVQSESKLTLHQYPVYWNSAWRIEADIRLDEFQDGSIVGTATGGLFQWSSQGDQIQTFNELTGSRWDSYGNFIIELTGYIDDAGYHLIAGEFPMQLPDTTDPSGVLNFWDFLYPEKIDGRWSEEAEASGNLIMEGESLRVQGKDYGETARQSNFREFNIVYRWSIRKL